MSKEIKEGISDEVNKLGQLVISVNIFKDDEFESKFNGDYIIDRPKFKHRTSIIKILDGMKTADSWQQVAVKIARQRGVQVKHVTKMLENGELTEEEEDMFNNVTDGFKNVDLEKLYEYAPQLMLETMVSAPVELNKLSDFDDLPLSVGRIVYEKSFNWIVNKLTIDEERRKK